MQQRVRNTEDGPRVRGHDSTTEKGVKERSTAPFSSLCAVQTRPLIWHGPRLPRSTEGSLVIQLHVSFKGRRVICVTRLSLKKLREILNTAPVEYSGRLLRRSQIDPSHAITVFRTN